MLSKHERQQLQMDLLLRKKVQQACGPEKIREATIRLCRTCRFYNSDVTTCTLMPLLLPLTAKGEQCPYYLTGREDTSSDRTK
jgi:hypothetical protein